MYDVEACPEITASAVEVLRYPTSAGERRVLARRGLRGIELMDEAVGAIGDMWSVDSGWTDGWELAAFLEDYRMQATLLDCCPMSREAISAVVEAGEAEPLLREIWAA